MYSSDDSFNSDYDFEYCDDFDNNLRFQKNSCTKSKEDLLSNDDDDFNERFLKYFWKKEEIKDFSSLAVIAGQIYSLDDLRLALKRDDVPSVEKFFKIGFNSKSKLNETGWTPLDYALFYASNKSLCFVIICDENVNLSSEVVIGGGSIAKDESRIMECLRILSEFGINYSREIVTELELKSDENSQLYEDNQSETNMYSILTVTIMDGVSIFLKSIQLSSLIPLFQNISFTEFLLLDDDDLQKVGVDEFSSRNEILYAIDSFHKCPWTDLSLNIQEVVKEMSGTKLIEFFTVVKHQLKIVESTLCYVKRLVAKNKPEDLKSMEEIEERNLQVKKNLRHLYDKVFEIRKTLDKICKKRISVLPHLIDYKKKKSRVWSKWLFVVCVPLLSTFLWYKIKS